MNTQRHHNSKTNRSWQFNFDLTHTGVCLVYGTREYLKKQVEKRMPMFVANGGLRDFDISHSQGCCVGSRRDNRSIIFLSNEHSVEYAETTYTLVHECTHSAHDIASFVNIPVAEESGNSEFIAYLVEYLYAACWRRLGKIHNGNRGHK